MGDYISKQIIMPIILSLAHYDQTLYAAGPEGLFYVEGDQLIAIAQPQVELACCAVADQRILVGGAPHGVAYTLSSFQDKGNETGETQGIGWQAGWMDGVDHSVYCIAADPRITTTGVLLAGSAGGGVLRTHNRGQTWRICNFGLQEFNVLSLAWAPPPAEDAWPAWEVVFAGTEAGLYRSPNGGRGWKRCEGVEGIIQAIAVAPDFQQSGVVLAGSESNGLWRSVDGGHLFVKVAAAPERINALLATCDGWLLSDPSGLWHSQDGETWHLLAGSKPALTLIQTAKGIYGGGEEGLASISLP